MVDSIFVVLGFLDDIFFTPAFCFFSIILGFLNENPVIALAIKMAFGPIGFLSMVLFAHMSWKTDWVKKVINFLYRRLTPVLLFNFVAFTTFAIGYGQVGAWFVPFIIFVLVQIKSTKGLSGKNLVAAWQASMHPSIYIYLPVHMAVFGTIQAANGQLCIAILYESVIFAVIGTFVIAIANAVASSWYHKVWAGVKETIISPVIWGIGVGFLVNQWCQECLLATVPTGSMYRIRVLLDMTSLVTVITGLWVIGICIYVGKSRGIQQKKAGLAMDLSEEKAQKKARIVASSIRLIGFPAVTLLVEMLLGGVVTLSAFFVTTLYWAMPTSPIGYLMTVSQSGEDNFTHALIMLRQIVVYSPFTVAGWIFIYQLLR